MGLLGVVLDSQKRYDEAEREYTRAVTISPKSSFLQNNLGNHYMARGKADQARVAYLKVLAIEPKHVNANLQLARISVEKNRGGEALQYLASLGPEQQGDPAVAILRAQALKLTNQNESAVRLLRSIEQQAVNDPRVAFSVGMTYVKWERYADAETAFTRALEADPTNFDILYNLGLAAQHAGHVQRAKEVYRAALQLRPNDPDCVLNLAAIYMQTGHADEAVVPLMQAHNAAPERADILFALAQTSQEIGFYADAATAIDKYLKLRPNDDVARRERGFCLIRSAKLAEGLEDLRWYTQKHPNDARGFYELAIAETVRESDKALEDVNRALALDPKFNPARYARGVLYYKLGKTQESMADLELVLKSNPNDVGSLDALGQNYLRLGKYTDAAEVLERAYKLAPKDSKVLTHYSRALIRLGRMEESEKLMADFKALGPEEGRRRPYGGLFEFLNLPPEQQYARYMENLQRTITTRPEDPGLRVQLGKTLLRQGKTAEAIEAFRAVHKLTSDPELLATCGRALLGFEQYGPAREFLGPAVAATPSASDLRLDLAIAVFHSANAGEALKVLDATRVDQRQGDYFLLRAQILDAMQKPEEAAEALNRGFEASPTRADLYFEAALFLIKHQQFKRAIQFLEQANRVAPDSPELQLLLAMTYEILRDHDSTIRLLTQIEARWPEWALPYMVEGITLAIRLRSAEARPVLENAIALGADNGVANYYLALVIVNSAPEKVDEALEPISKALRTIPEDFYVQSLAGKIAFLRKDYASALTYLHEALRLWPDMIEARQTLAGVYRAMGEREKSAEELKEIVRIKQENPTADQLPPFPATDLLFSVRPPPRSSP